MSYFYASSSLQQYSWNVVGKNVKKKETIKFSQIIFTHVIYKLLHNYVNTKWGQNTVVSEYDGMVFTKNKEYFKSK